MIRREFNRIAFAGLAAAAVAVPGRRAGANERRIRIGQIGVSHSHAEGKLATIQKLGDVFDFAGISEKQAGKKAAARVKPAFRGVKWMSEQALLETPGLEAVLIETDPDDLVETAMKCVSRGLHVHVDKPPGRSLKPLRRLLHSAGEKPVVVQTGYMFRYNPAFTFCLEVVRKGWLGKVFEVGGIISKAVREERRPGLTADYGGAMMLLGCHLIDMVIAVCGKPDRITGFRRRTHPSKDDLYDNELAVLEYPGITATVRSSLVEVDGQHRRQFVVCGTEGTLEISPLEPPAVLLSLCEDRGGYKKGSRQVRFPEMTGRYDDQLLHFAAMIQGKECNPWSAVHELNVQEALIQASGRL